MQANRSGIVLYCQIDLAHDRVDDGSIVIAESPPWIGLHECSVIGDCVFQPNDLRSGNRILSELQPVSVHSVNRVGEFSISIVAVLVLGVSIQSRHH